MQKRDYLETVTAFQDLTDDELASVEKKTHLVNYPAGHLFYLPDDEGEVLFILKQGRVQLYRMSSDGRKLVTHVLGAGAIFGHMALVGQGLYETYAQALDACVVCIWNREQVETLLVQNPRVALRFLEAVGQRLANVEDRLTDLAFKRVPARLASLLLRIAQDSPRALVIEGYTHQQLAEMIGIYRETVTQTLNRFKEDGLITVGRKRVTLLNPQRLRDIAHEG